MPPAETIQVHATACARRGRAVLLRGPSGAGKSDLALRLMDGGWLLLADDRCDLIRRAGGVWAACPKPLQGKIEARGAGVLTGLPFTPEARLALICDLGPSTPERPFERLPEPRFEDILGHAVRALALNPFEASAPAKINALMRACVL